MRDYAIFNSSYASTQSSILYEYFCVYSGRWALLQSLLDAYDICRIVTLELWCKDRSVNCSLLLNEHQSGLLAMVLTLGN